MAAFPGYPLCGNPEPPYDVISWQNKAAWLPASQSNKNKPGFDKEGLTMAMANFFLVKEGHKYLFTFMILHI